MASRQLFGVCALCLVWLVSTVGVRAMEDEVAPGPLELATEAVPETFLLPVLKNGPNNQKRDLRNALALAKELGCGIILTGVFKHHRENRDSSEVGNQPLQPNNSACFQDDSTSEWRNMDFNRALDRQPIESWIPTKTVAEMKQDGWTGQIDAVIESPGDMLKAMKYVNRTLDIAGASLAPAVRVLGSPRLRCSTRALDSMKKWIQGHRVVLLLPVLLGSVVVPDLEEEVVAAVPQDTCLRTQYEANRLVRGNPWLRDLASRYISQYLTQPFLAVHVRPYPDTCLDSWQKSTPGYPASISSDQCISQHKALHVQLGPCVANALREHNLTQVFVMAHPALRLVVDGLLSQEGVVHLTAEMVAALSGCEDQSATFLAMVEEEVAVQSSQFLGTYWSSITHSIVYSRLGLGKTANAFLETSCQWTAEGGQLGKPARTLFCRGIPSSCHTPP